jgi:RES domain-containing protein
MKIRVWRLVKADYAGEAFSGEGAAKYGGRWNSPGVRVVYTAQSLALATLEILAGGAPLSLLYRYAKIAAEFDDSIVYSAFPLPKKWNVYPPSPATRDVGDVWARESKSAVLKVPSAVIQEECIYVINPLHLEFKTKITIGKANPFSIDKRLGRALP